MDWLTASVYILSWLSVFQVYWSTQPPSIKLNPCRIPLRSQTLQLCCESHGIHSATVNFYKAISQSQTKVATIKHSCDVDIPANSLSLYNVSCTFNGAQSIYRLDVNHFYDESKLIGTWSCGYYGNTVYYTLKQEQLLTADSGFDYGDLGSNVTLTWRYLSQYPNFTINNPSGEPVLEVQNSIPIYQGSHVIYNNSVVDQGVSIMLTSITERDNGTYVYIRTNGKNVTRDGKTLVVLRQLDPPIMQPFNVSLKNSESKISGFVRCLATPKGVGPYFYHPNIQTNWIHPVQDVGYNITVNGSVIHLKNVNCMINASQPIFCSAKEGSSPVSERTHFFPHSLCFFHKVTTIAPSTSPKSEDDDRNALIAGVIISIISSMMFMLIVLCWRRRVRESFANVCCSLGKFLRRTFCRRCIKDDYMDSDSDLDRYISNLSRSDENSDWNQIANVYTPGDPTGIRIPRVEHNGTRIPRVEHNGNRILPPLPVLNINLDDDDTDTEPESTTDNNTGSENVVSSVDVNLNVAGAEGVDRNTIIKEVESGLRNLGKLLSRVQQQVQITRENLVDNLMDIYADPSIIDSSLHIRIVGEEGSDWGGVSRDVFTSFWNEVSSTYFQGDLVHVPYLPPHRLEEMYRFRLMGRILSHSTAILGYIPISICKSSMMVAIIDTTEIAEEVLLEDFLLFLDQDDRSVLQLAMADFSELSEEDKDKVQNIFIKFDMGCVLKKETLNEQVLKMARSELVIKPRSLCEKLREGIPENHYDQFWSQMSLDHLTVLYDRLKPTANKVLACLRSESLFLTEAKRKVFGYLKEFIKTLTERELEKLLQFVTGQACVPKRMITVQFSQLSGVQRRPIAHTCSYSIELPDSYENYEDFQNEFKNLLSADILRFDTQ